MGVELLAGGLAVAGIAVMMACHDLLRTMRLKRAPIAQNRAYRYRADN